jgi:hypothetical protein
MIQLIPKSVIAAIMRDPYLGHDLGIKTQEDIDLFFKTVINPKFWPDHLKEQDEKI